MAELVRLQVTEPDANGKRLRYLYYRCPGCETGWHQVVLRDPCPGAGRPSWLWNEDTECPTISPSVLQYSGRPNGSQGDARVTLCHHFVENGKIRYLDDCPHDLRGQTVDMIPWSAEEQALKEGGLQ